MKRLILLSILLSLISMFTLSARPATAILQDAKNQACQGLSASDTPDPNNCDPTTAGSGVNNLIATVINVFSFVVGVAAVIMIMVAGFKYITSSGDSASASSAKNTILYAIVGLVVVLFAQVIVRFVLHKATICPANTTVQDDGSCK